MKALILTLQFPDLLIEPSLVRKSLVALLLGRTPPLGEAGDLRLLVRKSLVAFLLGRAPPFFLIGTITQQSCDLTLKSIMPILKCFMGIAERAEIRDFSSPPLVLGKPVSLITKPGQALSMMITGLNQGLDWLGHHFFVQVTRSQSQTLQQHPEHNPSPIHCSIGSKVVSHRNQNRGESFRICIARTLE